MNQKGCEDRTPMAGRNFLQTSFSFYEALVLLIGLNIGLILRAKGDLDKEKISQSILSQ
jgi:hypothetical protein